MSRSHPPTLLSLAERLIRDTNMLPAGVTVVVAVSGGPDSLALLDVLARLRARLRFSVVAHGVDHGLRAEAARELELARDLAHRHDLELGITRVAVPRGGNLQSRARDARLGALRAAATACGATRIATGHHADDRAETVLLRLLRGSSPRGLACLPPVDGDLVRPLLRARRTDVLAHLARHRIAFAEDPSNLDPRFLRTRVRAELLPLLTRLSPGIVDHLNALADDLGAVPEGTWPASLRRAQRETARSAADRGRTDVRVRLAGGREAMVRFAAGRFVITEDGVGPSPPPKS